MFDEQPERDDDATDGRAADASDNDRGASRRAEGGADADG